MPLVEGCATTVGHASGAAHPCAPFPARNQQVEQDRASHVQSHYPELAWSTVSEPRSHTQFNREYQNPSWLTHSRRTGSRQLPNRNQDHRHTTQCVESKTSAISRRLELRGPSATKEIMV